MSIGRNNSRRILRNKVLKRYTSPPLTHLRNHCERIQEKNINVRRINTQKDSFTYEATIATGPKAMNEKMDLKILTLAT